MGEAFITRGGTGGGGGVNVIRIEVTTPPDITIYAPGQQINTQGMVVTATYSDGSTITVTDGCTVTPETAAADTQALEISYTLGGATVHTTYHPISVIQASDVLEENSWEIIAEVAALGGAPSLWSVGDTKTESLNGTSYTFRIVGFDHDSLDAGDARYGTSYNGGTNKAGITFEMAEIFATTYYMNSSDTNSGGWDGCYMRKTVMQNMKGYMSAALQGVLRTVSKLASAGSNSSTIQISADQLFLFSEIEVFGTTDQSYAGEGSQYAYYKAGNSKIKNKSGSAYYWWLRSPRSSGNIHFVGVRSDGALNYYSASSDGGVSFGFCV